MGTMDELLASSMMVQFQVCVFKWQLVCKFAVVEIMMTSSNGIIFRVTGHLCGVFTAPLWIPFTKASDAERWSAPWINGWVNSCVAGDLRRHRADYDVIDVWIFHWLHTFIHVLGFFNIKQILPIFPLWWFYPEIVVIQCTSHCYYP